jgi:hypothetical protein
MTLRLEVERLRHSRKQPYQFCSNCKKFSEQAILAAILPDPDRGGYVGPNYKHYRTVQDLKDGAKNDCHLCCIIMAGSEIRDVDKASSICARVRGQTEPYRSLWIAWIIMGNGDVVANSHWTDRTLYRGQRTIGNIECLTNIPEKLRYVRGALQIQGIPLNGMNQLRQKRVCK